MCDSYENVCDSYENVCDFHGNVFDSRENDALPMDVCGDGDVFGSVVDPVSHSGGLDDQL